MASEKILFISEGKSLIIHALQRNLTKNGYELIPCPLDVESVGSFFMKQLYDKLHD